MKDLFLITQARQLAEEATDNSMGNAVRMLIKQFLAMNVKDFKPIPELAVEHFIGTDTAKFAIDGVCMDIDNKVAVATSKHVLLVNPDEFVEVKKHTKGMVVVDVKDRTKVLKGTFPPYQQLIPDTKVTKTLIMRSLQDILFDAKHDIVEAQLNGVIPIVKIAEKKDNPCDVYIAVSKVPYLMATGIDGWEAMTDGQNVLERPLIKRFEDGKIVLIMTAKPGE